MNLALSLLLIPAFLVTLALFIVHQKETPVARRASSTASRRRRPIYGYGSHGGHAQGSYNPNRSGRFEPVAKRTEK